jgi:hypothetical protein
MTYAAHRKDFAPYLGHDTRTKSPVASAKGGSLRRFFAAVFTAISESRRRQVEQELARFVVRRGGRITDDLERQMMQFLMTSEWRNRE